MQPDRLSWQSQRAIHRFRRRAGFCLEPALGSSLCGHSLAQNTQLLLDIARIDDSAANLFPQNCTITRPQTRHIAPQRCGPAPKPLRHFPWHRSKRQFPVRCNFSASNNASLPATAYSCASRSSACRNSETAHSRSNTPSALQFRQRAACASTSESAASSRCTRRTPPPFLRSVTVTRVRQEMFQCPEQKRAEPSLHFIRFHVSTILDQICKKTLCEVLRIVLRNSLPPQKKINRPPINLTELGKRAERMLR